MSTAGTRDEDTAALGVVQRVAALATVQSSDEEGLLVSLWDMEMRYTITANDGLFVVQSSDRGTAPWLEMAGEGLPVAAQRRRAAVRMMRPVADARARAVAELSKAELSAGRPLELVHAFLNRDGLRVAGAVDRE
ncbi:hypothetical protein EV379_0431 [Microterricola gilva]|uniref:Uncharacterized protein n=1 Tax=Microterricola gilva TaxID=393267 RepID=A0A4Q8AI90_9MICO|nr:hypothetical protein [Microterricola gilva]RZU64137.1 hypothetical protein EV379_0431 [Microterricola gilva]